MIEEKKVETKEIPKYCSVWERRWAAAMSPEIVRRAVKKEILREECVRDILEKLEEK